MCFGDPVDKDGVPQAPLLLYLADQRPKHRKNYGKGGRYGSDVRTAGGGWQGKNDPRYRPRDEPSSAEHRGSGATHGGGGDRGGSGGGRVYPPGPHQGGGGGRVSLPPAVTTGRGNGGGAATVGGSRHGGSNSHASASQGSRQGGGGVQRAAAPPPAPPIVRDFGAPPGGQGGGGGAPPAPGMQFVTHSQGTPSVLSDSSSGAGNGAGAGRPRAGPGSRAHRGGGGDGQIPVGRPLVSPPPSEIGSIPSRRSHHPSTHGGGDAAVVNAEVRPATSSDSRSRPVGRPLVSPPPSRTSSIPSRRSHHSSIHGGRGPAVNAEARSGTSPASHSRAGSVHSRGTRRSGSSTRDGREVTNPPPRPLGTAAAPGSTPSRHSHHSSSRGDAAAMTSPRPLPSFHLQPPTQAHPSRAPSLARAPSHADTAPPTFRSVAGGSERALSVSGTEGARAAHGARNAGEVGSMAPTYRTVDPAALGRRGGSRAGRGRGGGSDAVVEGGWGRRRGMGGHDDNATLVD